MIIIGINIVNAHPAQSPESRLSKSRRSGRCLVMLISVMMNFVIVIITFIMNMPMNESAEGTTVFPRAAHVHHMDARVALDITKGEFDHNVMEGGCHSQNPDNKSAQIKHLDVN